MNRLVDRGVETLRQPDRHPRCYEMSDEERLARVQEWKDTDVWQAPEPAQQDLEQHYYGA